MPTRPALTPRAYVLAILLALCCVAAWSVLQLAPRRHALTISGTDITSNRHFFAKALQQAAAENSVDLTLRPTGGSQEALALVAANSLDLAFIQGGLDAPGADVVQVATVASELLHFLVRPGITDFAGLRGRRINLGTRKGGTRLVAHQILDFAGLHEEIDYVESNMSTEDLLTQLGERMPDAIVLTTLAPSDIVDYLVREQGYRLLEVPFAAAFALRHPWAAAADIGAYTYSAAPPVPARTVATVGVKLCLVANRRVDPRAIVRLLETLYGPALEARLQMHLDESLILSGRSYPPAAGTRRFMERNEPLFARELLDKLKGTIGLLLSVYSALLVVLKWLRRVPGPEAH